MLKAIEYLSESLNKDDELITLEKKYKKRFIDASEKYKIATEDHWIKDIISCYFDYFRYVLTSNSVEKAEEDLFLKLLKLVGDKRLSTLDEI
ncbi:hypothetical protein SAMN02745163_01950 [Clostridium cavendishii DSM 21758]|uniref:Uncharacterized protein n=1 Tax=Clostridium cavendishii DSM 21758 TaxID=1121302 RepID=A0A1M6J8W9_9CLOT|nr:hypothetical protein [Clostridium cavendishii]SHJ43114.1 hypothetical protein SAMN02745163_01950 [Clostridium cavendishii DSM 21758]